MQETASEARPSAVIFTNPAVPLTIEGASVLHQMMRFRWPQWRAESPETRAELISEAVTAMEAEATVETMMSTIHAHPTIYEAIGEAFNNVYGLAINV